MTKDEIINKAINKAVKNGWKGDNVPTKAIQLCIDDANEGKRDSKFIWCKDSDGKVTLLKDILNDSEFAKNLFKDLTPEDKNTKTQELKNSSDPIQFLELLV